MNQRLFRQAALQLGGFGLVLYLCVLSAIPGLAQTVAATVTVGSSPEAVAVNTVTNKIYVGELLKRLLLPLVLHRSCDLLFGRRTCCADFHGLHQVGGGCPFERQPVADFSNDALLQRVNEVHARVTPRHFRYLEIQSGEFPRSAERLSVRHNFGNHSPFVSRTCCQRLWIQQERLRSPRTSAIAPRCKDAVAGNNASSEVWQIGRSQLRRPRSHSQAAHIRNAHGRVPRWPRSPAPVCRPGFPESECLRREPGSKRRDRRRCRRMKNRWQEQSPRLLRSGLRSCSLEPFKVRPRHLDASGSSSNKTMHTSE
jgi:hypothetical protein